jgi:D-alanine-D-alanine ligase
MRVLIIYNQPVLPTTDRDAESEFEIVESGRSVRTELGDAGFDAACLAVGRDPNAILTSISEYRPDVIFNLFEGWADVPESEVHIAALLERHSIPFTGCSSRSLALSLDKYEANRLLRQSGLPTPDSVLVTNLPLAGQLIPQPAIVKPANRDGSLGIDQGSVVSDRNFLEERLVYLLRRYGGPVLVEQYIPGREFSVGLIESAGLIVLPILEIVFREEAGCWPILTHEGKWKPGSLDYERSVPDNHPQVPPELHKQLEDLARRTFCLLGCRDYARVDFRVSLSGVPYIIDVNPNPDINPQACFAGMLNAAGFSYSQFLANLLRRALDRADQVAIVNIAEAKYKCTFGRGCDGICCREGRPLVYPEDAAAITANLEKFLPLLRPKARQTLQQIGYLSGRRRLGQPIMRVCDGWCVFFHEGCVLHKVGAAEGDKFRYKPAVCALFPIQQDEDGRWYVRQKGYNKEKWNLLCLDPRTCRLPAAESLRDEIALAARYDREAAAIAATESSTSSGMDGSQ